MKEFNAKMNKGTKIMTVIVICIIIASVSTPVFISKDAGWLPSAITFGILLPIIIISYLLRPVKYIIEDRFLIIQKGIGSKEIERNEITDIRNVTAKDIGTGIRTFGVGGFFGYYGKFYYKKIGSVTAYVTNPEKLIYIKTKKGKQYLISPDDMLGFMNEMKREI